MLFTPVYNGVVWVHYELNKAYIAEKFCENKSKPELHCEGSCHVQKTLIQQEVPSAQEELPVAPSMARALLFFESTGIDSELPTFDKPGQSEYLCLYKSEYHETIFRPPIS